MDHFQENVQGNGKVTEFFLPNFYGQFLSELFYINATGLYDPSNAELPQFGTKLLIYDFCQCLYRYPHVTGQNYANDV